MTSAPLEVLIIKEPQNQLNENKYYRRGQKASKEGLGKEVNPYQLDEKISKLLRKRTYWLMGYDDFILSGKRRELELKLERAERKRQKHKDKKKKEKEKRRKERKKHRHDKHKHRH